MATSQHRDVVQVLDQLAGRHIPDLLRAQGFLGVRGEPAACPVALYVADRTGAEVLIQQDGWEFDPPGTTGGLLPAPVAAFVREFDRGLHPDLDRTRPE